LVWDEPSKRFSATSPAPSFSPLALAAMTLSLTSPGRPVRFGPVTPAVRSLPLASVSAVFVHVGAGSPSSNDE
jgi:hypothetical protein